ncbi:MAG: protein kinase [Vicinamibacterales bacterium]
MNVDDLCMGCMTDRQGALTCAACGYVEGTPPEELVHLRPRTRLQNYLIGRVLGHGGFGIAYIGWDENLEMRVAIKEYLPGRYATRSPDGTSVTPYSGEFKDVFDYGLTTFMDEGRAVARFNDHPGIIPVLNFLRANGTGYLVMNYVPGMTFKEYLDLKGGVISWSDTVAIATPVMDTLRVVHQVSLLHRDISPDNIYLSQSRQVKLLDFGAARIALGDKSQSLSTILKDGYAPKEQYLSRGRQGPYTDVYALAATMYRAVTGRKPPQALERVDHDELEPPRALGVDISPGAEAVLLKALAVDASSRFQTVTEFQEALSASALGADERTAPVRQTPRPAPTPAPIASPLPPVPPAPGPVVNADVFETVVRQVHQLATTVETLAAKALLGLRPAPAHDAPLRPIGLMLGALAGGLGALTNLSQLPMSMAFGIIAFLLALVALVVNATQAVGAVLALRGRTQAGTIVWSAAIVSIALTALGILNLVWPWLGVAGASYALTAVLSTAWMFAGPAFAFNGAILFCLWKRTSPPGVANIDVSR